MHRFRLWLAPIPALTGKGLTDFAFDLEHPVTVVSGKPQKGPYAASGTWLSLERGEVFVQSVKLPEDGSRAVLVRVCELEGNKAETALRFPAKVLKAGLVDLNEGSLPGAVHCEGNTVRFEARPYGVTTVRVELAAG